MPELRRLDAPERLRLLQGKVIDEAADPELDALVDEASKLAGAPIALVSLVLKHHQLFRAQVGLPKDLAATRATSRYVSFCQYVVGGDAPVVIDDAATTEGLPKDLVSRYGIRAYAGVPLRVSGQPLGSLCVMDTVPRDFAPELLARLAELGARASARLEQLSRRPQASDERVLSPAVAEARNHLAALLLEGESARQSLAELLPMVRLLRRAHELEDHEIARGVRSLTETAAALDDLAEMVSSMAASGERLAAVVTALGDTLLDRPVELTLGRVISGAVSLCADLARIGGGLKLGPFEHGVVLDHGFANAVMQVGRALVEGFEHSRTGATLTVEMRDLVVDVLVSPVGGGPQSVVPLRRKVQ